MNNKIRNNINSLQCNTLNLAPLRHSPNQKNISIVPFLMIYYGLKKEEMVTNLSYF